MTMTATPFVLALLFAKSGGSSYTPTFPGGFISWIVCYRARRQQIGGFLMFYYWSLFGGILITLIAFCANFESYVPESFNDPTRYHLFLLSIVPLLLVYTVQAIVGVLLLSVRTWDMLKLLRNLIMAELICALLGLTIDVNHFTDNTFFDVYTIAISSMWIGYFFLSKRVTHVFKLNDWDSFVEQIYPPTPPKAVAAT
jgi:hypothetical protein